MYGFQTPLILREDSETANDERGQWVVVQPLQYRSRLTNDFYEVPPGFSTDLASIPRIPLLWLWLGDTAREAAVLHDYLYTAPHITDRKTADMLLHEAAIETGWSPARARSTHSAAVAA
jgi:hypothetical protein